MTSLVDIDPLYASRNSEASLGEHVCITVADTGCGIDENTRKRLFEPFFTTKEVGKGTGMGLATAYGLVKQHNGWIEVESRPGLGSTFRVYLRASRKLAPVEEKKQNPSEPTGGRETILVVEDEAPLRELVATLLQEYGYDVRIASNGVEALDIWQRSSHEIDLLLTDVVMPQQISGIELAQRLRADRHDLKVIYTSGYSLELFDPQFRISTDFNFLAKPYPPVKLAEIIRTCLDN